MTTSTADTTPAGHVYDGIEEHDNRLPRWWLMTLWGAIVFAVLYWLAYEVFGALPQPQAIFDQEMVARRVEEERAAAARVVVGVAGPAANDDDLIALSRDAAAVGRGKALYISTCLACHAAKGEGLVGPNLTDDAWLHGDAPSEIHHTVADGFAEKGMPAWKAALGPAQVNDVVAFVLSIKGSHVPGKEPQGVVASR